MEKSGLPYTKVNVDSDTELSTKYGIRNVPTIVKVDASGNEVDRIVGNKPITEIKAWYNG
jgi:thioredoxin-like negative regulator of GroEL